VTTDASQPTGTSLKFTNMLASAVEDHCSKHGAVLDKLTKIVLEGEGTIEQRVNRYCLDRVVDVGHLTDVMTP
jgi:hypothetical protein